MNEQEHRRIGIVGARGYTGRELLALLREHGGFELDFASSRELAGQPIADTVDGWPDAAQTFEELSPEDVARRDLDVCVLALPNGVSPAFVEAIDAHSPQTKILDLSSDHRFDDAWQYGWPERLREQIAGATRVANPGCYATGMQAAIWPLVDLLDGPAQAFGVSGYSGAGTKPSPKNDPEVLRDNLLPYKLVEHTHEREVTRQMQHPVHFTPHVAPFFRGITLTVSMRLTNPASREGLLERYQRRYEGEPLVQWRDEIPLVRDNMQRHHVTVGGLALDETGRHAVVVATLDNLLKGAATQAMQNLNLLAGFDELRSIPREG